MMHGLDGLSLRYRCQSVLARSVTFVSFWLRWQLRRIHDRLGPAELAATEHLTGFWRSAALMAAVKLRIADRIAGQPGGQAIELTALADATKCCPDSLVRLLRPLANLGFFFEDPHGRWSNTRLSSALRHTSESAGRTRTAKSTLKRATIEGATIEGATIEGAKLGAAAVFQHDVQWQHWQQLAEVMRSGMSAAALTRELSATATLFDWLAKHPDDGQLFHNAMESVTSLALRPLMQAFPWNKYRSIIDIGGGTGQFLAGIPTSIRTDKTGRRTVLDLDHSKPQHLPEGITFVCKSFFDLQGELGGYELIVLKHILHDWKDADCLAILSQVSAHMDEHAHVAVIETLRDDSHYDLIAGFADLEMMQSFQSRERSEAEFAALMDRCGLKIVDTIHTLSPFKILLVKKRST